MNSEDKNTKEPVLAAPVSKNQQLNAPKHRSSYAGVSMAICALVAVMVGMIGFAVGTRMGGLSVVRPDYSQLDEVYAALQENYDGTLDKDKLLEGAKAGMVAAAGDPYTEYLSNEDAQNLTEDLSGEFNGVGIQMGLNEDKQLEIMSVLDGGSAKEAGLQTGDLIAKVDGEDSLTWTPSQAASKIRGEAGTKVKLTVIRGDEQKEYELERKKVDNPSVTWEEKDGVGFIRISQFGEDTGELARKAAEELTKKNVTGIVLDLRDNGGGYVDAAQDVASLWLDKGDTVVTERKGARVLDTLKATGDNILDGVPTTVLINGGTASASEIVAGALRDHGQATLVGEKSYGKGSVQQMMPLNNGGELKVTIAKWYTPKGTNINHDGLKPDTEVKFDEEKYLKGEDVQQDKAVELLKK